MENNNKALLWLNTKFILGLAIIISTIIGAYVFYQIRSFDNTLTVTGSASKQVTSDHVKWVGVISRVVKIGTLKEGYSELAKDLVFTQDFLKSKNIGSDQIVISPVLMEQNYDQTQGPERTYTLRQTIDINSSDINNISEIAKNINPLIEKGVVFSTQSLEYTYTKLPEERVEMLSSAVKDAKARASKLAESSGKSVGQLKSASSGVVQVMSANSLDISDYGSYDTSKIEKNIMLTVKASFTLK
ncbi:MAG: SIMPL domain-containing protein [Candidatus Nomurabacteria bacterium]|nr:SIMPL domain-containing protein [Candidatus Nomurabacteria bacterium]